MRSSRASWRVVAAAFAIAAITVLSACGEREERVTRGQTAHFDLALDWYPNPDHVGIYMALTRGYFADAGLEIAPHVPSDPAAPIKQVAAGRADLAISYEPEVAIAREQGLDVVAVGALATEPLTSLVSVGKGGIHSGRQLAGKRVSTAGIPYQAAFLRAILKEAGLEDSDVQRVDVGLNLLPSLVAGKVDASLGPFWNIEGVQLARDGKHPTVVPVDKLGIPTYDELVLVANGQRVADDPEPIRLFLAALERGTRDAAKDPGGATQALLRANDDLLPGLTRGQVGRTLPVLLPRGERQRFGFMDPAKWRDFAGFMVDENLIPSQPAIDELLTNDLLPGRIPG